MTKTLTEAEVADLFAGRARPPQSARPSGGPRAPRGPRYDKCHGCGHRQPCLSAFMGYHDWEPELPADSPVRAHVRRLRRETGRRTILLCGGCIAHFSEVAQPPPAEREMARLFEP